MIHYSNDFPNNTKRSISEIFNSATIQFGQTVYGGVVDFNTGIVKPYQEYASYNGETLTGHWISDRDVYAEGTTPTTGAQVVNDGAYDTDIQCAPAPLRLLKGTNNLSADGVMQIGYQPDNVIGELKGEIEQHLEMPWLQVIIEGEQDDFDEILLEDGGNIIRFPLADNEIYRHRFLLVEVYTTLLGLPMSLCGNAMLSTQTLMEFEHGAYIPLSIGNLTDGIAAKVYVGITADNEIQVQLESTASSPLTNIYIRARLVD